MSGSEQQRKELGDFLRARRAQLDREEFGLPTVGRSRRTGLRREEVSYLSGVSVTWYTWLEQGRDTNPSRQVLDAIAGALRLSPAERAYVLSLAGFAAAPPAEAPLATNAPPEVQRLLDALVGYPAFVITPDWSIAGWNDVYAALYPHVETVPRSDRNLLWLVFTDAYVREMLPNWDLDSRRFLTEFRAEAGPRLGMPHVAALVNRLQDASASFRTGWASRDVETFKSRERLFHHPRVGDLMLEEHRLTPTDHPDLRLIIYTPGTDEQTRRRLAGLVNGRHVNEDEGPVR